MTGLHVLGSGSKGNAYLIVAGEDALLVDAGFGPKTLARRAAQSGADLRGLRGVLLTHEHGDHARGGPSLARSHGVPVLASAGTWQALGAPPDLLHIPLRPARPAQVGPFVIETCATTHDAAEPLAVLVRPGNGLRLAFATDLGRATAGIRYLLRGAQAIVLEANYDDLLLRSGRYPASVQARIAGSQGHLSNRAAAALLAEVCHHDLQAVVLGHLSQESNTADHARSAVTPALAARGFRGELWVAAQDHPLPAIRLPAGDRDPAGPPLRPDAASPAPRG